MLNRIGQNNVKYDLILLPLNPLQPVPLHPTFLLLYRQRTNFKLLNLKLLYETSQNFQN